MMDTTAFNQLTEDYNLTMESVYLGKAKDDDGWEYFSWMCHIRRGKGESVTQSLPYRLGLGHVVEGRAVPGVKGSGKPKRPKMLDVLAGMSRDATSAEGSFADWCGDLGYDQDSRKALAIYLACQESGIQLRKLLGWDGVRRLREAVQDW
jgi:hypothetical protein